VDLVRRGTDVDQAIPAHSSLDAGCGDLYGGVLSNRKSRQPNARHRDVRNLHATGGSERIVETHLDFDATVILRMVLMPGTNDFLSTSPMTDRVATEFTKRLAHSRPSGWDIAPSATNAAVAATLALSGKLMAPLLWRLVLVQLGAAAGFALVLDRLDAPAVAAFKVA
jgi:hypothetical protein